MARIAPGLQRAQSRATLTSSMASVRQEGDLQDATDRLDLELRSMLIDESLLDLVRRLSSAWAKNALASMRISLASRNSRFRS